MTLPRVAILISGRGSNMEAILQATQTGILKGRCSICGVIANRADADGVTRARALGVAARVIPSKDVGTKAYGAKLLAALAEWSPDFLVLAGFMRILSADVIAAYRGRIVNIHPADTAAYQGPDGYGWAANEKLTETMITVHLVDEGVDTGPVLEQQIVPLDGAESRSAIAERGLPIEHSLYSQCLANLFAGHYDAILASMQQREERE